MCASRAIRTFLPLLAIVVLSGDLAPSGALSRSEALAESCVTEACVKDESSSFGEEESSLLALTRNRAGAETAGAGKHKGWVNFPPGHEITSLPNMCPWARGSLRMSSGYIPVSKDGSKQLFYWFVESQGNPSKDPLLLWTNGGPGCSGLLGFMTEMGPLRPSSKGDLVLNPHAWTKFANMVFIEQPAGVGFSYPLNDFEYTDAVAAEDNWEFVKGFLELYPQLKSSPFWLTSESYGGHYVPTLARLMLQENNGEVDFKGIIVGNPLIYLPYTNYGLFGMWHAWTLLPEPEYQSYLENECWWLNDESKPIKPMPDSQVSTCLDLVDGFYNLTGGLDAYALGFPTCSTGEAATIMKRLVPRWLSGLFAKFKYVACSEDYAVEYLNRKDVQAALHVKGPVKWSGCANVNYSSASVDADMTLVIKDIVDQGGLQMMIMSGNEDSVCAALGDQQWMWKTGYNNSEAWSAYSLDGQVAGYTTAFKAGNGYGFRYTTVQGAGHMIPMTQPKRGAYIVKKFVSGEWPL